MLVGRNAIPLPLALLLAVTLVWLPSEEACAKKPKRQAHTTTAHHSVKHGSTTVAGSRRHTGSSRPTFAVTPDKNPIATDERIASLRGWLQQRNAERGGGESSGSLIEPEPREFRVDQPPPGKRRRLDFTYTPPPDPEAENTAGVLRIGRGPDGRVYHRYVVKGSDTEVPGFSGTGETRATGKDSRSDQDRDMAISSDLDDFFQSNHKAVTKKKAYSSRLAAKKPAITRKPSGRKRKKP